MRLIEGPVTVTVPATSANLGPGFDALGLALDLRDELTAAVGTTTSITATGEGADQIPHDETHLVIRAMRATFDRLGVQPDGIELRTTNVIPHGRGLGSSAAAIVGGILLARALVDDGDTRLPTADALALASSIEGHPDNVAPCLLGGFTIAWADDAGRAAARRLDPTGIHPVVFVPPTALSTEVARAALPAQVPHAHAARNASRAALLVAAMTGAPELLLVATEDLLHQPYRAPSMPASAELLDRLRAAGHAAVISGAGPSVLVLATNPDESGECRKLVPDGWVVFPLAVDLSGAGSAPEPR